VRGCYRETGANLQECGDFTEGGGRIRWPQFLQSTTTFLLRATLPKGVAVSRHTEAEEARLPQRSTSPEGRKQRMRERQGP
jgi:hypothetical protein